MCTEGTESPHWSLPIAMLIEEAAISLAHCDQVVVGRSDLGDVAQVPASWIAS